MNSERLAALAALADARAARERRDLLRDRDALEALHRRRAELAGHAGRYRREPMDGEPRPPALIAHRHLYSAGLAAQLERIDTHVAERHAALDALAARCRRSAARHEALKLAERRAADDEQDAARAQERRVDAEYARRRPARRGRR